MIMNQVCFRCAKEGHGRNGHIFQTKNTGKEEFDSMPIEQPVVRTLSTGCVGFELAVPDRPIRTTIAMN